MRFVVTAGPTREAIDPVRYLSNRSSGKMGYAIAAAARTAGHDVLLVSGPVSLAGPAGVDLVRVTTAMEMLQAVKTSLAGCDVFVMCAAVSDYRPVSVSRSKLKKGTAPLSLDLLPTPDILSTVSGGKRSFLSVGFAAETNALESNAREKLERKGCDIIVANDVSREEIGMESDENEVVLFFPDAPPRRISRSPKAEIARELVKIFLETRQKSLTKKSW